MAGEGDLLGDSKTEDLRPSDFPGRVESRPGDHQRKISASQQRYDGLALGESTALSLGLPVKSLRWLMLAVLALCTAAAVAQTGLIAFVGLAAPHLVRARVKALHGKTLSLSCLMGAVLLGGTDLLARGLMAP